MPNQQLIDFYRGNGKDAAGRTLAQILAFDHRKLEDVHDYIQWIFPTAKASAYNMSAPLLDEETAAVFASDDTIRERMLEALRVMLDFYGLRLDMREGVAVVHKAASYAARKDNWQDPFMGSINHNLLRLTRIMESLTLCGLNDYAVALYGCLAAIQQEEPRKIPARTASFWQAAVQPLEA